MTLVWVRHVMAPPPSPCSARPVPNRASRRPRPLRDPPVRRVAQRNLPGRTERPHPIRSLPLSSFPFEPGRPSGLQGNPPPIRPLGKGSPPTGTSRVRSLFASSHRFVRRIRPKHELREARHVESEAIRRTLDRNTRRWRPAEDAMRARGARYALEALRRSRDGGHTRCFAAQVRGAMDRRRKAWKKRTWRRKRMNGRRGLARPERRGRGGGPWKRRKPETAEKPEEERRAGTPVDAIVLLD